MLNIHHFRKILDRSAKTTYEADFLGREIEERLIERQPFFRIQPRRVLLIGARTKALSEHFKQLYPDADFVTLDLSDQQIKEHKEKGRMAAVSQFAPLPFFDASFDLVVSSLMLTWSNDFAATFREIERILSPNGLFLFTLFGVETLKELRESFSDCHDYLYAFPDMHDIGDLLLQTDFDDPVMDMETITVRYKALKTLFSDLKAAGYTNAHDQRPRSLFSKSAWHKAIRHYESLKVSGAFPASVEIIYGHAWKEIDDEKSTSNEVFVSVDSIR